MLIAVVICVVPKAFVFRTTYTFPHHNTPPPPDTDPLSVIKQLHKTFCNTSHLSKAEITNVRQAVSEQVGEREEREKRRRPRAEEEK